MKKTVKFINEPEVSLVEYTQDALEILLLSKNTRLKASGFTSALDEIRSWSAEKKEEELSYLRDTIKSSWEFVSFTFSISNVSRAFTHQLVRSRQLSFAQLSHRTVDATGFGFVNPSPGEKLDLEFENMISGISDAYECLVHEKGFHPQKARSILPTNVETGILVKANLRSLHDMGKLRLCTRASGEYQTVFRKMKDEVVKVYPWTDKFIRVACASDGVCVFPRYAECKVKSGIFNPDTGGVWADNGVDSEFGKTPLTKDQIQEKWSGIFQEAEPVHKTREK